MNTNLISLKYQYFSQLRKPVREEVLKLMEGDDIDSVSSDAVLAYRIINHFEQEAAAAAASAPAAAASNVAASKSVANNQQPVEPWLAAAQPDGPANDADDDAMVDAAVVDADDTDEANEVNAAGVVNAAVDEVGEVGRPSCMPRQPRLYLWTVANRMPTRRRS